MGLPICSGADRQVFILDAAFDITSTSTLLYLVYALVVTAI